MTPEKLHALLIKSFGERGKKTATTAMCWVKTNPEALVGAKQGGTFKMDKPKGVTRIVDARGSAVTRLTKTEWTGFHAEMIIISALLNLGEFKPINGAKLKLAATKTFLQKNYKEVIIVADAPCCKHCGHMLDKLGVSYHGKKGAAGLTGWWNPLTDKVTPNADAGFQKEVPGI